MVRVNKYYTTKSVARSLGEKNQSCPLGVRDGILSLPVNQSERYPIVTICELMNVEEGIWHFLASVLS